jgi:hypothetical protein
MIEVNASQDPPDVVFQRIQAGLKQTALKDLIRQ